MSFMVMWILSCMEKWQCSEPLRKLWSWCRCCHGFVLNISMFGLFHSLRLQTLLSSWLVWLWKKVWIKALDMSVWREGSIQLRHCLRIFAFLSFLRLVLLVWRNRDRPWVRGEESKLGVLPDSREQQQACRTLLWTARWPNRSGRPH